MDSLDRIIIGELSANCRASFTELAEKYDVSVNTIKKRVEKLVQENVIVAFDVQIPLEALGASFGVIFLELAQKWSKEEINRLGNHQNIFAMSMGFQSEAIALMVYRNNAEMMGVIDYVRTFPSITNLRIVPLLPPLSYTMPPKSKPLDSLKKIDWRILQALQRNGRMQLSELSERVNASVPSVRKRLDYLRSNGFVSETVLINPGSVSQGIVVIFNLRVEEMSDGTQLSVESLLLEKFPESYWLSWRIADRPELLLVFQSPNAKEVVNLQERILQIIPNSVIADQLILGEWEYFPDFRQEIIDSHLK
ncbi:MAG: Lrp/AsnC family transcriptional regulator [Candidatus Thorarchaeota archaeon]